MRKEDAGYLLQSTRLIKSLHMKGNKDFGVGCHTASSERYFYNGGRQNNPRILRTASTVFPMLGSFLRLAYTAIRSHTMFDIIDKALLAGDFCTVMKITNIACVLSNDIQSIYELCRASLC